MYLLEQFIKAIDALWSLGFNLLFVIGIYLIPTFIAYYRKHEKKVIITIINIFIGWTFIAWVACIIWAILGKPSNKIK
jgi:Superinfection immunity protein